VRALLVVVAFLSVSGLACAGAPSQQGQQAGPAGGERLYRSKCSACHRAYPPASRDRSSWAEVMAKMAPRAKLSDEERAHVLDYLQSNAKDAPEAGAHP
jgi:mono/diheme cytochrome c family protein